MKYNKTGKKAKSTKGRTKHRGYRSDSPPEVSFQVRIFWFKNAVDPTKETHKQNCKGPPKPRSDDDNGSAGGGKGIMTQRNGGEARGFNRWRTGKSDEREYCMELVGDASFGMNWAYKSGSLFLVFITNSKRSCRDMFQDSLLWNTSLHLKEEDLGKYLSSFFLNWL